MELKASFWGTPLRKDVRSPHSCLRSNSARMNRKSRANTEALNAVFLLFL